MKRWFELWVRKNAPIKLVVKCPFCGFEFITTTVKRVRCYNCERTFRVFYREKKGSELKSRVLLILKGEDKIKKLLGDVSGSPIRNDR